MVIDNMEEWQSVSDMASAKPLPVGQGGQQIPLQAPTPIDRKTPANNEMRTAIVALE